jgi:hypothetical protein
LPELNGIDDGLQFCFSCAGHLPGVFLGGAFCAFEFPRRQFNLPSEAIVVWDICTIFWQAALGRESKAIALKQFPR